MALETGTRFGPYEVVEQIGSGGMGVVWRARDTSLKRDVAIKALPESFAADADRLSRFRREAEILASLNHPNIATIHGLEKSDVIQLAAAYRAALEHQGCRVLSEKRNPMKHRVTFLILGPQGLRRRELESRIGKDLAEPLKGSVDWQTE